MVYRDQCCRSYSWVQFPKERDHSEQRKRETRKKTHVNDRIWYIHLRLRTRIQTLHHYSIISTSSLPVIANRLLHQLNLPLLVHSSSSNSSHLQRRFPHPNLPSLTSHPIFCRFQRKNTRSRINRFSTEFPQFWRSRRWWIDGFVLFQVS